MQRLSKLIAPDPTGEFPFEVSEYIIQAIHRIARARDIEFETALAPLSLNVTRYRVLVAVVRAEGCTMSDLAVLIGYDRTTLARAIDQMVAAGLLQRLPVPSDRRFVELSVTDEGQALYQRTIAIAESLNDTFFAGVDEYAQRAVLRGLQAMAANLGVTPDYIVKTLGPRWS